MAKRESFHVDGFHPGQPIPVATRIGNIVMTGLVPAADPATHAFAPDAAGQVAQMFKNLETIIGAAGATLGDVIRVTVYVKDRAIRSALNPVWSQYFPDERSCPARAVMPTDGIANGALITCEAMAVLVTGSRIVRVAAIALAVACVVVLVARVLQPSGPLAPDFTLTDQNGKPYTLSAQRGHPVALFFGYAHCPDVCPTTLSALAVAKRKLGEAGKTFDVVLVTVDPKRDSPAVLGRYVRLFDPSFAGLTGTQAQLDPVYAAYHIEHEIDATKASANGYTVAHSSVVQFIAPSGRLRGTGNYSDTPDEMAVLMKQALS